MTYIDKLNGFVRALSFPHSAASIVWESIGPDGADNTEVIGEKIAYLIDGEDYEELGKLIAEQAKRYVES